ncbi:MAG: T9SS type A sorting domain-containing protein [Bacteroidota bacterium]
MKRMGQSFFYLFIAAAFPLGSLFAQRPDTLVIATFDHSVADGLWAFSRWGEWDVPPPERNNLFAADTSNGVQKEGAGALRVQWQVRTPNHGGWFGGGANMEYLGYKSHTPPYLPDLSSYTHLNLWIRVIRGSTLASHLNFRVVLWDSSEGDGGREFWAAHPKVKLDSAMADWMLISIPLNNIGISVPDFVDSGFGIGVWDGNKGNGILDLDRLTAFQFEVVGAPDSTDENGLFLVDYMFATGYRTVAPRDTSPPIPPSVNVSPGADYRNVITWNDVEPRVKYNVYLSDKPITDVTASDVEDLPPYNRTTGAEPMYHFLRAPVHDQDVTYYYAVTAKDSAGNLSQPGISAAITNKAQGVPTISKTPPANFRADGDLSEWANIAPIILSVAQGTAHIAPGGVLENDNDLLVKAYLATDHDNLYVAFDVTDDIVKVDTTQSSGAQDAPDLYIGLYDWRGKRHSGLSRGATPDYHLRFAKNKILDDQLGVDFMYASPSNPNYIWMEKPISPGYVVEAKIPFRLLAEGGHDSLFVPLEGMRLPIDFIINDRDNKPYDAGAPWLTRDCALCYSPLNDDNAWAGQWHWTYTWIGEKWTVGVEDQPSIPLVYELKQNYPNPFNPVTTISYTVEKSGNVLLKVYDILGREVATLVNEFQNGGRHSVNFSSPNLPSGVYLYQLRAGSFEDVKKMVLLK